MWFSLFWVKVLWNEKEQWTFTSAPEPCTTSNNRCISLTSSTVLFTGETLEQCQSTATLELVRKDYRSQMAFSPIVTVKPILTVSHRHWICGASTAHQICKLKQEKSLRCSSESWGPEFLPNPDPPPPFIRIIKAMPQYCKALSPSFLKWWWSFVVWLAMKKRAKCELERNNSVVNDLDVRQGVEKGAGLF